MPRRDLNARQVDTLDRLLAAARDELGEVGHEVLTIRTVAARAGVSSATAYNYFASRDHLFAELFWRHLVDRGRAQADRAQRHAPAAADDATSRGDDRTRTRAGRCCDQEPARHRPGRRASCGCGSGPCSPTGSARPSGDGVDPKVLDTLLIAFSGALLQTGMGLFTYPELADRLDDVVAVIMRGNA